MEENKTLKILFKKVFEKAREESLEESKTGQAKYLAETKFLEGPGFKTYVRYYNQYVLDNKTEVGKPGIDRLNQLAVFCGYQNFADFSQQQNANLNKKTPPLDKQIKAVDKDEIPTSTKKINDDIKKADVSEKKVKKSEATAEDKTENKATDLNQEKTNKSDDVPPKRIPKEVKTSNLSNINKEKKKVNRPYKIPPKDLPKKDKSSIASNTDQKKKKKRNRWFVVAVFLIGIVGLYYLYDEFAGGETGSENQGPYACVKWNGSSYDKVGCEDSDAIKTATYEEYATYNRKEKITIDRNTKFFDNTSREPLVWYDVNYGDYEFFNFSGNHPVNNRKLIPVTQDFLAEYFQDQNGFGEMASDLGGSDEDGEVLPCETYLTGSLLIQNMINKKIKVTLEGPDRTTLQYSIDANARKLFANLSAGEYNIKYYDYSSQNYYKEEVIDLYACLENKVSFDYNLKEDPYEIGPFCQLNKKGRLVIENLSNSKIYFTYSNPALLATSVVDIKAKSSTVLHSIPALDYDYTVRLKNGGGVVESGTFKLKVCEEKKLKFNPVIEEPPVETVSKPACESNRTGNLYFYNSGIAVVRLRVSSNVNSSFETQEYLLQAKEKKYFYDLPVQVYQYSAHHNTANGLIEKSEVTVKQCSEVGRTIDGRIESETADSGTSGTKTSSDCAIEKTGDFCFKNNGSRTVHIVLSDYSPHSPLSREFDPMDVEPGEEGCYYGKLEGTYKARYFYDKNEMDSKYKTVKVVVCQSGSASLK